MTKTNASHLSLSRESNSKCSTTFTITITITLSDLLKISSYFINFSHSIVRYICLLERNVKVLYNKQIREKIIKDKITISENTFSSFHNYGDSEIDFSSDYYGKALQFKIEADYYLNVDLEVLDFLINNCIKKNYLPKSNFIVEVDTNLGAFQDEYLCSPEIEWSFTRIIMKFIDHEENRKFPSFYMSYINPDEIIAIDLI